MRLLTEQIFEEITGASQNIDERRFESALTSVEDGELPNIISQALTDDLKALDDEEATDLATEKYNFYNSYVKKYLAWAVYVELVPKMVGSWTSESIVTFTDGANTSQALSSANMQTVLDAGYKNKGMYESKMKFKLNDVYGTFDSTEYTLESNFTGVTNNTSNITAIGKRKYNRSNRI